MKRLPCRSDQISEPQYAVAPDPVQATTRGPPPTSWASSHCMAARSRTALPHPSRPHRATVQTVLGSTSGVLAGSVRAVALAQSLLQTMLLARLALVLVTCSMCLLLGSVGWSMFGLSRSRPAAQQEQVSPPVVPEPKPEHKVPLLVGEARGDLQLFADVAGAARIGDILPGDLQAG